MTVKMSVIFDREDVQQILKEAYITKFGPAPEGFSLSCDCGRYDTIPSITVVAVPKKQEFGPIPDPEIASGKNVKAEDVGF